MRPAALTVPRAQPATTLPWIQVAPGTPYFLDDTGRPFTPIGHNDAISWINLQGLFRRRDLPAVEAHLRMLVEHGVTVIRLMIEYAQVRHRYLEKPAGVFVPAMVQLWDDLVAICERVGMRLLLTPVDTFWMWMHWRHHPWNIAHGGPLARMNEVLLCPATRAVIKARLTFMVERWGGSGAIFAWDLWNEIHPAQGGDSIESFPAFIADLSQHVRALEQRRYGRAHPQTVSLFGPEIWWRPDDDFGPSIFRHPDLDFATIHIYKEGSIDDPKNTIAPAGAMGQIVRDCLAEMPPERPFLDTEHGPIHRFKDKKQQLPEAFDDEYFRHMAWAHLASGGAGGGMRWANRNPHVLTPGMHRAQRAMAAFEPLIDWARFKRRNLNEEITAKNFNTFGCGDDAQAIVWLLRRRGLNSDGRLPADLPPVPVEVTVPGLATGGYRVTAFDTATGRPDAPMDARASDGTLRFRPAPVGPDRAYAIRRK